MSSITMGRPVRILTVSFTGRAADCTPENPYPIRSLDEMVGYLKQAAVVDGHDMIVLPEFWPGASTIEDLDGPVITTMRSLAAEYRTYLICPISRKTERVPKLNTAVLIGRDGSIVGLYDKLYPYWGEYDIAPAPKAGSELPVFDLDFGRTAIAICFDANFPHIWEEYGRRGVDVVFWPSAYSAGCQLQAHAINNNYYIVSATTAGTCLVYDINGDRICYESAPEVNVTRVTLDLDRGIYHNDFNLEVLPTFLEQHADEVELERCMELESWFILRSRVQGVHVRELARAAGLKELQVYKFESRARIDHYREHGAFSEKAGETL